ASAALVEAAHRRARSSVVRIGIPCYLAPMADPKKRLQQALEEWRKEDLKNATAKAPLRRAEFHTDSGIPIPDLLVPSEPSAEEAEKYERDLGFPGRFPYTRGP